MDQRLNDRQRRFAVEFVKDLCGKQAAIRAGYSEKTAESQASRLLSHAKVSAEVERLKIARAKRTLIDADWLLARLADEAEADLADLYEEDGRLKPVHKWPAVWRKGLVAGIEIETLRSKEEDTEETTITKIKLSERIKRLELIGKHVGVGAFKEKVEHTVADPLADLLREISGNTIKPKEG